MVLHEILWALQQRVAGNSSSDDELMEVNAFFPDSVKLYKQQFSELVHHLEHVHNYIKTIETRKSKSSDDEQSGKTTGLYKQAFCSGIKEVLSNFSPLFIELEELILNDEHFSVISMATKLPPLAQVVRATKDAVVELESKEIVGCQVLDVCKNYCQSGMPSVESAFKIVYKTCLKPFFLQTNFWLLRAELYDPFNEYFISACETEVTHDCDSGSIAASSVSSLDALDYSKASCYKIVLEKLPFFIPYSMAKKVLFVGESLIMCQQDPTMKVELLERRREKILESCGLGPFDVLSKMHQLEDCETLNVDSFDAFISDIFNGVNRYARQLAEEIADVRGQLVLMRDLYLLGRGELFQEFILRSKSYLNRPAHKAKIRCLKAFFDDAFYYTYLTEDSEILDAVSFTFPSKDVIPQGATALDCLNLEVKIKWPLDTIFSPDVMSCFRRMFRFLLKLKKAQITLSNAWLEMNCTNERSNASIIHQMTFLRNKLSAFVGNLQSYCFTDVIEDEMQELLRVVDNSNTYTAIQYAVGVFQSNVLEKLFLNLGAADDYFPLGQDTLDWTEDTVNTTQQSQGSRGSGTEKSKQRTIRDRKTRSLFHPERSIREQKTRSLVFSEKSSLFKGTTEDLNLEMQKMFAEIFSCCLKFGKCAANLKSVQDFQLVDIETKTDAAIQLLYLLSKTYDDNGHLPILLFRLDFNGFFRNNFDPAVL
uniref:Gamma-tubulin complex component n=1 Tax=Lygus hesperus TaxID=30085 RepID=A0A0A9X8V5_LYGHE